ncbi:hypothetical protein BwSH20_60190 [Bradyrhizobium ottawaense]|uniref:hypothetical protein n=1 Tax=Bradyrhizobium ottawaense TaxID=931866 RepID=UPI0012A2F6C2|nr:hypothetical protein SG09_32150 [Bradyrhizobium ottawaense]GMO13428.1 hypothetical protein BwSH14_00140 [Bradyrhizobium ottawaense]GMO45917.1 hypothetical protein BwSF21_61810 [Bradyrhizobium ottawaense]GMO49210.1 hypothetical protein BwSF12_57690 [Bradyrhizobium ottawaense]GMO65000.1 hypothetical protein BwSG10_16790 [Bradyrhizobium ottawaense]
MEQINLRIHHFQKQACLFRQLARAPGEAETRERGQKQDNERQPPGSFEWKDRRQSSRQCVQKGGEQHPGKDNQKAGDHLPDQE